MDNNRFCVIMCGGVGSRFWPYSRKAMPKQFIDFLGTGRSLLQLTADRLEGVVDLGDVSKIAVGVPVIYLQHGAGLPVRRRMEVEFAVEHMRIRRI